MFDLLSSIIQGNVLVAILSLVLVLWAARVLVTRQSRLDITTTPSTSQQQPLRPDPKQRDIPPAPAPLITGSQLHHEPPTMITTAPTPTSTNPIPIPPRTTGFMPMPWRASFSLDPSSSSPSLFSSPSSDPHRARALRSDSIVGRKGSGSTCGRWSSDDGGSEGGQSRYGSFTGESVFAGIGGQFGGRRG